MTSSHLTSRQRWTIVAARDRSKRPAGVADLVLGYDKQGFCAGTGGVVASKLPEFRLRVPGVGRQHAGIDTDLAQCAHILFIGVGAKDQIRIGVAVQPAIALNFVLELAGGPAGITQRQNRALRSGSFRDRPEDIDSRGEANAAVDL